MPAPLHIVEFGHAIPKRADTVVIGGGIVGTATAYWLARAGQQVVLLEKGRVGAEQSSRNWGWVRQQNRDARELPLATHSLRLWEEMTRDIGQDLGFRKSGLLYLSDDPAEIATWAKWVRFAQGEGLDTRMLSAAETVDRAVSTGRAWAGGVWAPTDGIADPSRAAPLIAVGIAKHGGQVVQNCAARALEVEAGRVTGVITEHGTIKAQQVVLAGGAWAGSFLHQIGLPFPQATIRSSVIALAPGAEELPPALHTKGITITRRGDGGHTLAISGLGLVDPTPAMLAHARHFIPMFARRWRLVKPGGTEGWRSGFATRRLWRADRPTPMERMRILDPRPSPRAVAETLRRAQALLPALRALPVRSTWAGMIDMTPDGVPVIDGGLPLSGLVVAAGFSGHGFGIGPGAGHLVADIVLGRQPITKVEQYRLSRFGQAAWGKVSEF
ncbi:FAD-binding oxidoreductase [Lichenihabitans sp. Uapishka_5]|uniref:NAD(P)/FAD-dependent oxidoreductase n=1 Tax=Lichenihabitans sp. Uapishka_5 TaxID=3037302 RepID=UPI0029E7E090|nr:FAD-binding oxidoreductase [Lichenihabitans sp. Uapishka_5]MDX7950545.1 FAD-binding oxidoreductase [Lichenihabitans sp. Uapishka_5]